MSDSNSTIQIEYREIPRFVGYRFGDDGSAWSRWPRGGKGPMKATWKRLGGSSDRHGYLHVTLRDASIGRKKSYLLHRVILEAFRGPCPPGMEARHLDGDPANERLLNLEWATHLDNASDKVRHGTETFGSRNGKARFIEEQILDIRERWAKGVTCAELARIHHVDGSTISLIVNGHTWKHVTWSDSP
jgi:hypothetical protein